MGCRSMKVISLEQNTEANAYSKYGGPESSIALQLKKHLQIEKCFKDVLNEQDKNKIKCKLKKNL